MRSGSMAKTLVTTGRAQVSRLSLMVCVVGCAMLGVSAVRAESLVCAEEAGAPDSQCSRSPDTWSDESGEDDLDMFVIVPHLEDRELGEPNLDDEGDVVIWDHPLPFFGQAVTELGFELPLPFGISLVPATFCLLYTSPSPRD